MAKGIFNGCSIPELLAIRTKALAEVTAGASVTSYSIAGTSVGKQVIPALERLQEANHSLNILDPEAYPMTEDTTVIRTNWDNYAD
jgi:hypothetical protein